MEQVQQMRHSGQAQGRPVIFTLAWLCAGISLFAQLARAGIWDPYELEVAELSRRIAVTLMDSPALALPGTDNRVPILSELGKGQLPFSSVALGFKVFGLNDWAGRLPLALWALFGVVATYLLVRRLLDRAAAPYAVLMLASCPLYFLQSRTMLGDAVTLAAVALACTGLALAVFDVRLKPGSLTWWAALVVGILGLVCGFGSRGVLVGVAVPACAIALTALLVPPPHSSWRSARALVALACGALALVAIGVGTDALLAASPKQYSMLVGSEVIKIKNLPTHDSVLHALAHGLLPWSALVPFALAALLRPAPSEDSAAGYSGEAALRVLLLVVTTLAFLAHGLLAPFVGDLPYCAVFAFAAAVAVLARDLERGRPASLATGIGALALLVLLVLDYRQFPDKGLSAFAVGGVKFPETFKENAERYLAIGGVVALVCCVVGFWERDPEPMPRTTAGGWRAALSAPVRAARALFSREFWRAQTAFQRDDYRAWPDALRGLLRGNPLYTLLPLELMTLALLLQHKAWFGFRPFPKDWFAKVSPLLLTYAWLVLPILLLVPVLILLLRDGARLLLRSLAIPRATVAVLGFASFGLVLSLGYYPALASQLSPREVFDSYRRFAKDGDELGMIGASSGTAAYYTGSGTHVLPDVMRAADWLLEPTQARRYVVVAAADLGRLNSQYRAKTNPARNLPVVDARSSEIALASNRLDDGNNQNPLTAIVLDQRPNPAHAKGGTFDDEITCIGWEIVDREGQVTDRLDKGVPYKLRLYYEVLAKVSGSWKTFVHLDAAERINLDHETAGGKYPHGLWNKGDFILDEHEFTVPRGQVSGRYSVNFGLFQGTRRKDVTSGTHDDDRLTVGDIEVR